MRTRAVLLLVVVGACSTRSSKPDAAGAADAAAPARDGAPPRLLATELLGRPTATSVTVNAVPGSDVEVFFERGTSPGAYTERTATALHPGGQPFEVTMDGLSPDRRHVYRMRWRAPGEADFAAGPERSFHTARPRGQPFVVTLQADPHLDEISNLDLYHQALANQLADAPDFMLDLGDTFMCEKHAAPLTATVQAAPDYATVAARYLYERGNFGLVAHSVPLLLVNGNHEGEAGWLNGGAENLAVWATRARKAYYVAPLPDGFYSAGSADRGSAYAWEWGDALFVVLDPFWYTTSKPKDGWGFTLGLAQVRWLAQTLQSSSAPFRFVFIHNLVGGDSQGRGGVEVAPYYEWGGKNLDGSDGLAAQRPGWDKPIHQLLVEGHVTAVFHGHDHVYVKQELDGIVYQELAQPSAPNFTGGPSLAAKQGYQSGTIVSSSGHLRLSVGPTQTKVEYVRAYRPQDETAQRHNREVSDSYMLLPR